MSISIGALAALAGGSKASDLVNQLATTAFSNYLGGKNEKKSLERQYWYSQQYALNNPSWQVQGLRKAGLNPILAATDGAFSSPTVPSVGRNNPSGSDGSSIDLMGKVIDSERLEIERRVANSNIETNLKTQELQQAQADQARSVSTLNAVKAANEMRTRGLGGIAGGAMGAYEELKEAVPRGVDAIIDIFKNVDTSFLDKFVPSHSSRPSHEVKSRNAPDDSSSSSSSSSYVPDFYDDYDIPNHGWFKSRHKFDGQKIRKLREGRNPYFYR